MRILYRALMSLLMMLALLLLASCSGAPGCPQAGFGNSAGCGPGGNGSFGGGGGGGGGGNNGNATPTAFVFAVDTVGGANGTGTNGTIDGYDLSTSAGTFKPLSGFTAPQVPANFPGLGMVVARKQFVYALMDGTSANGIYGWSINATSGSLTAITPVLVNLSLSLLSYNQYGITTDPGGNFLYVADTNTSQILVFTITSSGALTAGTPVSTPGEPGCLTTDGLGKYLYVCVTAGDHNGFPQILGYSIGTNGALTPLTGSPFALSPGMFQLQGDASGKYLVGTSGETTAILGTDDNHLYVFSIQQPGQANPGAISIAPGSPVSTQFSPFTIAMQPPSSNGEFVYSFSLIDGGGGYNPIEGYQLLANGTLQRLSNSPFSGFSATSAWGQFDQSGANLLLYSTSTSATDPIGEVFSNGTAEVIPLEVATDGTLTQKVSAAPLVTPGYWVVTDP